MSAMNVNDDILKQLRDPLPERMISWRVGSTNQDKTRGQALPYIDNRIVQNRLDDVVGPSNWTNRYEEVVVDNRLLAVRCIIGVRVDGQWVEKEDAAHLDDSSQGSRELAIKGVYSDAMKRAAVQWGIGRYLYDFQAPWVALDEYKRLGEIPRLPAHMLPAGEAANQAPGHAPAPAAAPEAAKPAAVKRETSAPAPAPAAAEAKPAEAKPVEAKKDEAAPASAHAEVLAPTKSAEPVKQEEAPAPAPAPAAEPVKAQAAVAAEASSTASSGEMPEGLTPEQKALVADLLTKLEKLKPHMIRSYVTGPKGQEKLNVAARDYVLAKVAEKEAQLEQA